MFQESIRSTQWEIQHQKQHVKQHVKHWFFATVVAGAGKGNFQLPDTAAVSPFYKTKSSKYLSQYVNKLWTVYIESTFLLRVPSLDCQC